MAVYVDDMRWPFGRMFMSHMIADTSVELVAMAKRIGVNPKWIQHPGTYREHFDICQSMRGKALRAGAVGISYLRDYPRMIDARRDAAVLAAYFAPEAGGSGERGATGARAAGAGGDQGAFGF